VRRTVPARRRRAYRRGVPFPFADSLWQADADLAARCLRHPFVRGLADGSLSLARYRDYVAQDAFFLRAFARAYELAAARCGDAGGARLYAALRAGVDDELRLHRALAARLRIDLERVVPGDATLAYTEFLLATAALESEAHAAAAMLPCLRLYAWLGAELLPNLTTDGPTAEWVRAYAAPEFQALWPVLAARVEGAAPAVRSELAVLHRRAMHLEERFFAAAFGGELPDVVVPVLTIAGSDPSGGAGVQADLKTFHRLGCHGQAVLTLLTAQNTRGVQGVFPVPVDQVRAQLRSVLGDLGAKAIKTGALGAAELVAAVGEQLRALAGRRLVVDPVLVSKHGQALAAPEVGAALRRHLLPLALVVTPNRHEAACLTGIEVTDRTSAERAAQLLRRDGAEVVVVKDVPGAAADLYVDGAGSQLLERPHVETRHRHGSGCTFSAAVVAQLARGLATHDAVSAAQDFVVRALASAPGLGEIGPLNHWA